MKPILLALFVATAAHADGVPLFAPSSSVSAANEARFTLIAKEPWFVSLTLIKIDPNALESDVMTVNIEGKTYKLVGKLTPASGTTWVNGVLTKNTVDSWVGDAGPDMPVVLTREGSNVDGTIFVNLTHYWLTSGGLVKTKDVPYPTTVTPEMVEFHRKEQEEYDAKQAKVPSPGR